MTATDMEKAGTHAKLHTTFCGTHFPRTDIFASPRAIEKNKEARTSKAGKPRKESKNTSKKERERKTSNKAENVRNRKRQIAKQMRGQPAKPKSQETMPKPLPKALRT